MRYVAIGDSFTEGVGDALPDGGVRGWADRLAAGLSARLAERGEPLQYANLAVRGRLLHPIVTDQLEAALALDPAPDLLTLNGGGNDMLRPGVRLDRLLRLTEHAIHRCAESGVRLVLLSGADPTAHLPLGGLVQRRATYLTAGLTDLSTRHAVTLVNVFGDRELRARGYWAADRLHLNSRGHERVAGLVLHSLGFAQAPATDPPGDLGPGGGLGADARYYREHVLPWIHRRLRGRSSGDERAAKHPAWNLVAPTEPTGAR
ncbi:SGNH/GDSL hydrolase family protein [Actinocrinis puniceicyclus]|uniref:SGNH/GDSL hydrolase family protein n=1 Tax=Actinocrinis puniceicyclus TaxID=977794 RepID=A0A8J7WNP6_9ACTN|nr:SGNH/GDSL hydrolase family protein [Actinocrinis puniceicyclus]MBS2965726.1 SGNH/GDSL hydrolase family protein [Actinocrinis puniceicyclus]